MRKITVEYLISDEEEKRLERLLQRYREYKNDDGSRPFEKWEVEDLFDVLMTEGCKWDINDRLSFKERVFGINAEENNGKE